MNQMSSEISGTDAIARFGRVIAVAGTRIVALLDGAKAPRIGELVKITTVNSTVFGFVTGLSIDIPSTSGVELRRVELEVVGEIDHRNNGRAIFQRGVATYPSLDDPLLPAAQDDLRRVFTRPGRQEDGARIGSLHQDPTIPAVIVPAELLGKHFAVLGTTGAGKSCAITTILRAILGQHPAAERGIRKFDGCIGHVLRILGLIRP